LRVRPSLLSDEIPSVLLPVSCHSVVRGFFAPRVLSILWNVDWFIKKTLVFKLMMDICRYICTWVSFPTRKCCMPNWFIILHDITHLTVFL
jgi:hypothetical protein